jgi:hypothetical protein
MVVPEEFGGMENMEGTNRKLINKNRAIKRII